MFFKVKLEDLLTVESQEDISISEENAFSADETSMPTASEKVFHSVFQPDKTVCSGDEISTPATSKTNIRYVSNPPLKRKYDNSRIDEVFSIMRSVCEDKRTKDEFDSFGEQVAYKIRKINNDQTRSNVQQIINTILWEAGLGKYDNYHHHMQNQITLPLSSTSTNPSISSSPELSFS